MKYLVLSSFVLLFVSCWKDWAGNRSQSLTKVWGSRPVYAAITDAERIVYDPHKHPVAAAGNIYTFGNFIFQADVGRGIHVINSTVASQANRVGFITVNGCAEMSVQGSYLYTNSYCDLIVIDISDPLNVKLVNRVAGAFPQFQYDYPLAEPDESGYYECVRYDSVVIGWVKDSVYNSCYKN